MPLASARHETPFDEPEDNPMIRALFRQLILLVASLASSAALMGLLTVAGVFGNVHNAGAVRQDQALQDVTATHVAVQTAAPATLALTR